MSLRLLFISWVFSVSLYDGSPLARRTEGPSEGGHKGCPFASKEKGLYYADGFQNKDGKFIKDLLKLKGLGLPIPTPDEKQDGSFPLPSDGEKVKDGKKGVNTEKDTVKGKETSGGKVKKEDRKGTVGKETSKTHVRSSKIDDEGGSVAGKYVVGKKQKDEDDVPHAMSFNKPAAVFGKICRPFFLGKDDVYLGIPMGKSVVGNKVMSKEDVVGKKHFVGKKADIGKEEISPAFFVGKPELFGEDGKPHFFGEYGVPLIIPKEKQSAIHKNGKEHIIGKKVVSKDDVIDHEDSFIKPVYVKRHDTSRVVSVVKKSLLKKEVDADEPSHTNPVSKKALVGNENVIIKKSPLSVAARPGGIQILNDGVRKKEQRNVHAKVKENFHFAADSWFSAKGGEGLKFESNGPMKKGRKGVGYTELKESLKTEWNISGKNHKLLDTKAKHTEKGAKGSKKSGEKTTEKKEGEKTEKPDKNDEKVETELVDDNDKAEEEKSREKASGENGKDIEEFAKKTSSSLKGEIDAGAGDSKVEEVHELGKPGM